MIFDCEIRLGVQYKVGVRRGVRHGAGDPETAGQEPPHLPRLVPELGKQARRKPEVPRDISNLAALEALFCKIKFWASCY